MYAITREKRSVSNRASILVNLYPKDVFIGLEWLLLQVQVFDKKAVIDGVMLVDLERCFLSYF